MPMMEAKRPRKKNHSFFKKEPSTNHGGHQDAVAQIAAVNKATTGSAQT